MAQSPWRQALRAASVLAAIVTTVPRAAGQHPAAQLDTVEVSSLVGMVVSGSPEASEVGARVLEQGGNAVDAAVAAAFALGVSEPGQSGLGGQTYILLRLADGHAAAIDGSALAPLRFDRSELRRMRDRGERNGHQLAATPGSLAALAYALARYGTFPLQAVIAPAVELADRGTHVTAFQRSMLDHYLERVRASDQLSHLYLEDGIVPWGLEHRYCQPELARTLWRLGEHGAADYYVGRIAGEIAADMERNGGYVRAGDLGLMRVTEREPLRGTYRGLEVLAFPAPCAGSAVIETLQILERFPPELLRSNTMERVHVMLEAERLAEADQGLVRSTASAACRQVTSRELAARRAAVIRLDRALRPDEVGAVDSGMGRDRDTTHLSVADRFGNVVSLTQSLGRGFGSCAFDPGLGFLYNGLLEGFELENARSRHYLQPMRPLFVSMAPTIVVRDGRPFLVLGSAGSSRIAPSVATTIIQVVDGGMTLAQAQAAPRALWGSSDERNLVIELAPPFSAATVRELEARGFTGITAVAFPASMLTLSRAGGVNAIMLGGDGTAVGVCDPRRGGSAAAACETGAPSAPPSPSPEYWRHRFAGGKPPLPDRTAPANTPGS